MPTPDEIPPPPKVPGEPPQSRWFYAGPIAIDITAMICTTVLVALGVLPVDNFKYLVGVLVVGNVALRMPGGKLPPGGGGLIVAVVSNALINLKGFKS